MFKYNDFQELHKHKGSENYQVVELFENNFEIRGNVLADNQNKSIVVNAFKIQKLKDRDIYQTKLLTTLADEINVMENSYRTLKDGTIWASYFYCNFIINNDTTKYRYLDPFSNVEIENPYEIESKEKDTEKWLEKFKELYENASYVYESSWNYYFKIKEKWYFLKYNLEVVYANFVKNHPPKEDQDVRMLGLSDITPDFYGKTGLQEETFMRIVGYKEEEHQSGSGLNPISGTAGYHFIELHMPLGDVIKIKRFGTMGVNIQTYKIPAQYNGRNDVVFIVQEADLELFPGREFGGMYAIRPRDPKQPQRRYKKIVYKTDKDGAEVIDTAKSVETEAYKLWKKGKK